MKPERPTIAKPSAASVAGGNRKGKNIVADGINKTKEKDVVKSLSIEVSDDVDKKAPRSTSPLRMSQTLGEGVNRVLLCLDLDNESIEQDLDGLMEADESFFFQESTVSSISAETSLVENVPTEATAILTDQSPKDKEVVEQSPSPQKVPRKTRMKQRFTYLKQAMPQYKIDKTMRKTIVDTMVDLNYWSDKSSGEESGDEFDEKAIKSPPPSQRRQRTPSTSTTSTKNDNTATPPRPSTDLNNEANNPPDHPPAGSPPRHRKSIRIYQSPALPSAEEKKEQQEKEQSPSQKPKKVKIIQPPSRDPSPAKQPDRSRSPAKETIAPPPTTEGTHTIHDLAKPTEIKAKIPLVKPKQIQIPIATQTKIAKYEKTSLDERKNIREHIVNKAVQLFIKLEKDTNTTKEVKYQNLVKEKNEKQLQLLKRFAMGIVEKAMKKMKSHEKERLLKKRERVIKLYEKKLHNAAKIFRFWRRCRLRRYCYFLLLIGQQIQVEKKQAEEREQYEYRYRVAQRRINENQVFLQWKQEKKEVMKQQIKEIKRQQVIPSLEAIKNTVLPPPSPTKGKRKGKSKGGKSPNKPLPPKGKQQTVTSPVKKNEKRKDSVSSDISDGELIRFAEHPLPSADEQLFSEDPRVTRPDLAPFSTMINSMIHKYLKPQPPTTSKPINRQQSVAFSMMAEVPFTSLLSAKFSKSKSRDPLRSQASFSQSLFSESIPAVEASSPRSMSPRLGRSGFFRGDSLAKDLNPGLPPSTPALQPLEPSFSMEWEKDADLTQLPSMQSLKQNPQYKSPAFKALEKLSNLTEADIRRVRREVNERDIINEIIKQKRNQTTHLIFL